MVPDNSQLTPDVLAAFKGEEPAPTEAIPQDAPEASIPDSPGEAPVAEPPMEETGDAPAEPPMGEGPMGEDTPGGEEGDLPVDPAQWEETTIVEGVGTPEPHEDPFWRSGNWGIEADQDGKYEAYAIVDETPMMIEGGFESFEEAAMYLNQNMNRKKLADSGEGSKELADSGEGSKEPPSEGEESAEGSEEGGAPAEKKEEDGAPAEEKEDSPEKEDDSSEKEDDSSEKKDEDESESTKKSYPQGYEEDVENGAGKEDPPSDEEMKSMATRKSASGAESTDSIRAMMGSYWSQRTHGVANLPRTGTSMNDIAKSKNPTAAVGGIRVRIGYDRDSVDDLTPDKAKHDKSNEGSMRHIDPSVRNAMAPPARGGKANVKAPDMDSLHESPNKPSGHSNNGVKPADGVY